ncbi:MAG: nucleoside deaminase [Rickettsiaceae bacterium]|nr:nucleoside deaminase [Rickettsiaceae bacterium]
MQLAFEYAKKAFDKNEVPVGCVILHFPTNTIIAQTHNKVEEQKDCTWHAEIEAIKIASALLNSKNLSECDMYITLEPCTMCISAISNSRIRRLYYAVADPKQGAVESGVKFLDSPSCYHYPEVYSNIMENESRELLVRFFQKLRLADKKSDFYS